MNPSEEADRRRAEPSSKDELSDVEVEMLARVSQVLDSPEARPLFARVARAAEERQRTAEFVVPKAHLYLGNVWRLAGDDERAHQHLIRAREMLAPKARAAAQYVAPFLFTVFLLGDDDALLAAGEEFGEQRSGEIGWALVAAVRASRRRRGRTGEALGRLGRTRRRRACRHRRPPSLVPRPARRTGHETRATT